jgi:hypothetical protein
MAIVEGLLTLLEQFVSQLITIPLENTLGYLYTILNIVLLLFGMSLGGEAAF